MQIAEFSCAKATDVKVQDQNDGDLLSWHQWYHPLWICSWRNHC
jgi:hypothetical protein